MSTAEVGMKLIGILLIVFGVVALTIGGINYTKREKVLVIVHHKATTETRKTIPISPIAGIAAIVGGVVLVASGKKSLV